jgi:polar amino acid transport system substrate-binding protein
MLRRATAVGISIITCLLAADACATSLAEIQRRGWIRVCAHPDALPFSSQDPSQPGFQLEIADAIAKILGVRVTPEWIVYTRHARRADCDAVIGAVVTLTGQEKTPARGAMLTRPYVGGGYVLAVSGSNTTVHRLEDVKPGKIGVEYTSWPHYQLQTHGFATSAYGSQTDIIEAIANGEIPAGMVTEPYLGWFRKGHPGQSVKMADGYVRDPDLQWNTAIRLITADQALRDKVDQALEQLLADRTIPNILAKYGVTYVPPFNR